MLNHVPTLFKDKKVRSKIAKRQNLAISSTIWFNDPTSLVTECFKHFVVVTMLGKLVVTVHSQPSKDLRRDRSPPSLSPLVVLSLPPRRHSRP